MPKNSVARRHVLRLGAALALLSMPALAELAPPAAPDDPNKPSGDASTAQVLELEARPAAMLSGEAKWDDGFEVIGKAFATINGEVAKAGLTAIARPITVFLQTDDNGFHYQAMVPLAALPEGKDALGGDVKLGRTPPGKAIRFQHRAAYSEIDSTYEAITAYLDEKGLEAQNLFIEEYLTEPKAADDDTLQVDIYVFVK